MTAADVHVRLASDLDLELAEEAQTWQAFLTLHGENGLPVTVAFGPDAALRLQAVLQEQVRACDWCDRNLATMRAEEFHICTECAPVYDDEPVRDE